MYKRQGEGGTQTVAEERNLSPRPVWGYEERGGGAQRWRLGQTEASDKPVRQYAYQERTYPAYAKAEEGQGKQENGTTVRAGPKNAKLIVRRQHENVTSISACLLREGDNSRGKRTQETRDRKATDLETDYCYTGGSLALLMSLTQRA